MNIFKDSKPSPCHGCPKRLVGCHATCKEGKEADERRAEERRIAHERAALTRSLNAIGKGYYK